MVKVEGITIRFMRRPDGEDVADMILAVLGLAVVALWAYILWR